MNFWSFVALVVIVSGIVSIFRARYGIRRDKEGNEFAVNSDSETLRLTEEVRQLKERLAVLERIAVDRENILERQIEELRDR